MYLCHIVYSFYGGQMPMIFLFPFFMEGQRDLCAPVMVALFKIKAVRICFQCSHPDLFLKVPTGAHLPAFNKLFYVWILGQN